MSLLKFIISAVLAIIFLYFTITGIQNVMQAQKEVEQAQKEVDETSRELQHWTSEAEKSKAFYEAHGCTYQGDAMWHCPEGEC
jgi:uncharacterized membrane-anchored protein YhcB (DUF1043 family)